MSPVPPEMPADWAAHFVELAAPGTAPVEPAHGDGADLSPAPSPQLDLDPLIHDLIVWAQVWHRADAPHIERALHDAIERFERRHGTLPTRRGTT